MRWLTVGAAMVLAATTAGPAAAARPPVQVDPTVPAPPAVHGAAWLVADLDTGSVLAARDRHRRLAPASTLKILTALTLAPRLDPAAGYVARQQDAAIEGSKVGLVPGSRYRVDDLLHGLLLGSGNDAATALASLAGGTARTAELMTERARELGASDTVVANPSGLDAAGQVSSPHDLAVLGRAALAERRLARIVATRTYRFPAAGKGFSSRRKHFQIQNHNRLLWNYRGTTGLKNGFTEAARASYVVSARRGDRRYIVTVMRARPGSWRDAAALLDWAFAVGARARPVARLDEQPGLTTPSPAQAGTGTDPALPAAAAAAVAGTGASSAPPGDRVGLPAVGGLIAVVVVVVVGLAVVLLAGRPRLGAPRRARATRRPAGSGQRRPGPAPRPRLPASRRRR